MDNLTAWLLGVPVPATAPSDEEAASDTRLGAVAVLRLHPDRELSRDGGGVFRIWLGSVRLVADDRFNHSYAFVSDRPDHYKLSFHGPGDPAGDNSIALETVRGRFIHP